MVRGQLALGGWGEVVRGQLVLGVEVVRGQPPPPGSEVNHFPRVRGQPPPPSWSEVNYLPPHGQRSTTSPSWSEVNHPHPPHQDTYGHYGQCTVGTHPTGNAFLFASWSRVPLRIVNKEGNLGLRLSCP